LRGIDGVVVTFAGEHYSIVDVSCLERAVELLFDDGYGEVALDSEYLLVLESDQGTGFVHIWIKNQNTGKEVALYEFSERETKKLKRLFQVEVVS